MGRKTDADVNALKTRGPNLSCASKRKQRSLDHRRFPLHRSLEKEGLVARPVRCAKPAKQNVVIGGLPFLHNESAEGSWRGVVRTDDSTPDLTPMATMHLLFGGIILPLSPVLFLSVYVYRKVASYLQQSKQLHDPLLGEEGVEDDGGYLPPSATYCSMMRLEEEKQGYSKTQQRGAEMTLLVGGEDYAPADSAQNVSLSLPLSPADQPPVARPSSFLAPPYPRRPAAQPCALSTVPLDPPSPVLPTPACLAAPAAPAAQSSLWSQLLPSPRAFLSPPTSPPPASAGLDSDWQLPDDPASPTPASGCSSSAAEGGAEATEAEEAYAVLQEPEYVPAALLDRYLAPPTQQHNLHTGPAQASHWADSVQVELAPAEDCELEVHNLLGGCGTVARYQTWPDTCSESDSESAVLLPPQAAWSMLPPPPMPQYAA
eukprot:g51830.t1